jgi:hypothetical protein
LRERRHWRGTQQPNAAGRRVVVAEVWATARPLAMIVVKLGSNGGTRGTSKSVMERALCLLGVCELSMLGARGKEDGEKDQHIQEYARFREVRAP